jgi:hypothetical protein
VVTPFDLTVEHCHGYSHINMYGATLADGEGAIEVPGKRYRKYPIRLWFDDVGGRPERIKVPRRERTVPAHVEHLLKRNCNVAHAVAQDWFNANTKSPKLQYLLSCYRLGVYNVTLDPTR